MHPMEIKAARFPVGIVVLATVLAPASQQCDNEASPGAVADGGVGSADTATSASASHGGGVPDGTPVEAAAPAAASVPSSSRDGSSTSTAYDASDAYDASGAYDTSDAYAASGAYDASSEPVAPSPDASASGTEEAGTDDGGPSAVWANWPMPNSPSSGLPNPQSYDTSVAGTALDRVTGLTWERDASVLATADYASASGVLEQASAYCAGLDLAGFHDWRVPTRIELVSIMDFTLDPAENSTVFTVTAAALLSSSQHGIGSATGAIVGTAWMGDGTTSTTGGSVSYYGVSNGELQAPDAVRCVRGYVTASGAHYAIANGTVHDNWTGLTWLQSPSGLMFPSAVGSYCSGLTQAGGGWRAPSANELETLWGDFYDPDAVDLDPDAFAATLELEQLRLSSSDVYVGPPGGSTATEWAYVTSQAAIGDQDDVFFILPTPYGPAPPITDDQVYAQCVR